MEWGGFYVFGVVGGGRGGGEVVRAEGRGWSWIKRWITYL